jgi:predicted nuclease with RNAse H fold
MKFLAERQVRRLGGCDVEADRAMNADQGCERAQLDCTCPGFTRLTQRGRPTQTTLPNGVSIWELYARFTPPFEHVTDCRQNLKRISVIEDDEAEIIEAVRRMSERYDFVVTRHVSHLLLSSN